MGAGLVGLRVVTRPQYGTCELAGEAARHITSPSTKSEVSHRGEMREEEAALRFRIIRPKVM